MHGLLTWKSDSAYMLAVERPVVEEPKMRRITRQSVYEFLFLDHLAVVLLNSCACDSGFQHSSILIIGRNYGSWDSYILIS